MVLGIEVKERDVSFSTFPVTSIFYLDLGDHIDSFFLDFNIDGSSFEGHGDVGLIETWRPDIIELIIDMEVFVMQRIAQVIWIYHVQLLLEDSSNRIDLQNIIEQSRQG